MLILNVNDKWTKRGKPSWFNKYEKIKKEKINTKNLHNVKIELLNSVKYKLKTKDFIVF